MVENALIFYRKYLRRKSFGWFGDFPSWQDAERLASGYDADNILEQVKQATLKVKTGAAVYERDSVIFDQIEYSFPLLSALMFVAAKNKGHLKIIDFGGSLGSSFFQNKRFLDSMQRVLWTVVEQQNFVECGRSAIADDRLRFAYTIEEAEQSGKSDMLVLACTLPYLESPYDLINEIIRQKIPYIILDNTPFNYEKRDRITIQKVPPSIYQASYPCWFLDYSSVLKRFAKDYQVVTEFTNDTIIELDGRKIPYRGFLLELKQSA